MLNSVMVACTNFFVLLHELVMRMHTNLVMFVFIRHLSISRTNTYSKILLAELYLCCEVLSPTARTGPLQSLLVVLVSFGDGTKVINRKN